MTTLSRPKGTRDYYDLDAQKMTLIRQSFLEISAFFNYQYWETPIFEKSDLFIRSSGELSDIVNKELYLFQDKGKRSLALRPEGTAPTLRAFAEAKKPLPAKLAYFGPMFRYERPQKGRQRQFLSAGIEWLSHNFNFFSYETILLGVKLMQKLGIEDYKIHLNWLGSPQEIALYNEALKTYFLPFKEQLSLQSQKRLQQNPLRILDDKIDNQKDFVKNAPQLKDFVAPKSWKIFQKQASELKKILDPQKITLVYDQTLVRGLDYYQDLVFEFISDNQKLGAKTTILGGGCYQKILEEFQLPGAYGVGFGLGVDRLMLLLKEQPCISSKSIKKVLAFASTSQEVALLVAWRSQVKALKKQKELFSLVILYETTTFKKIFKNKKYLLYDAFLYFEDEKLVFKRQKEKVFLSKEAWFQEISNILEREKDEKISKWRIE